MNTLYFLLGFVGVFILASNSNGNKLPTFLKECPYFDKKFVEECSENGALCTCTTRGGFSKKCVDLCPVSGVVNPEKCRKIPDPRRDLVNKRYCCDVWQCEDEDILPPPYIDDNNNGYYDNKETRVNRHLRFDYVKMSPSNNGLSRQARGSPTDCPRKNGQYLTGCDDRARRCTCENGKLIGCVDACPPIRPKDPSRCIPIPNPRRDPVRMQNCCNVWDCPEDRRSRREELSQNDGLDYFKRSSNDNGYIKRGDYYYPRP